MMDDVVVVSSRADESADTAVVEMGAASTPTEALLPQQGALPPVDPAEPPAVLAPVEDNPERGQQSKHRHGHRHRHHERRSSKDHRGDKENLLHDGELSSLPQPPLAHTPPPEVDFQSPLPHQMPRVSIDAGLARARDHQKMNVPHVVITVHSMSPLEPDANVVHPLVRAWIVDGDTGRSLAVQRHGKATCGLTFPFDMQERESTSPCWNEEVALPLAVALEDVPRAVLLFELLDFGSINIRGETVPYRASLPIAWGFLRVQDSLGITNEGRKLNVQLFVPPTERSCLQSMMQMLTPSCLGPPQAQPLAGPFMGGGATMPKDPAEVPDIFYVYAQPRNRMVCYPGALCVLFRVCPPTMAPEPVATNASPNEAALLALFLNNASPEELTAFESVSKMRHSRERKAKESAHVNYDYERHRGERSLPPNVVLHGVSIPDAVTALCFSSNGNLLAVATSSDFGAKICLFDVFSPTLECVGMLRGHVDFIHFISFSKDSLSLVSCSTDKTAKVWSVAMLPCNVANSIDETAILKATLGHPSYVYGAVFVRSSLITVGYCTTMFVWSLSNGSLTMKIPALTASFFRCIVCDPASEVKLWTLDSSGQLATWRATIDESTREVVDISLRRHIDCAGATALQVQGSYAALYCPSDSLMFIVESSSFKIVHRIVGMPKDGVSYALLPDSKVFVVGMSNGRLLAWESLTGEMCSSRDGSPHLQVDFRITKLLWSPVHNIGVAVSDVTETMDTRLAIFGRPRREDEVITENDPNAANMIRYLFSGTVKFKGGALRPGALPGLSGAPAETPRRFGEEEPARDKEKRVDQILRYWRSLVGSRRGVPQ